MVSLKNCSIKDFFSISTNKKIYAFGVSKTLETYNVYRAPDYDLLNIIYQLVDSDKMKWGTNYYYNKKEIPIISPEIMCKNIEKVDIILITSRIYYGEIIEYLDSHEELNEIDCYILNFIDDIFDSKVDEERYIESKNKYYCIPPQIHYCWFGSEKIPEVYQSYIDSWKTMCPNYEITRWDEKNYNVKKNTYLRWAYDHQKWAFVSDYVRLDVIYSYGGIYLDTDVELIQSLDELRKFHCYIGYESTQITNTGLGFGAEKGNSAIEMMKNIYESIVIERENIFPCTVYQTNVLYSLGLKGDNSFQIIPKGKVAVLPTEFLCGIRLYTGEIQKTKNTFSLHHYYTGGWKKIENTLLINSAKTEYVNKILRRFS